MGPMASVEELVSTSGRCVGMLAEVAGASLSGGLLYE